MGYTPNYVLDEMEMYEILPIIEHLHLKVKDGWEQSRMVAWAALAPHQKSPKPMNEFIEFSWEKEEVEEIDDTPITAEEMAAHAARITDILNNNGKT